MYSANRRPVSRHQEYHQLLPVSYLQENHQRLSTVVKDGPRWTVYSASQNLSAVLSDPSRGKQQDFFTKIWGNNFVEREQIINSIHLPEICLQNFVAYQKKIVQKFKKHQKLNAILLMPSSDNELLKYIPNFRRSKNTDKIHSNLRRIPKIFLQPNMNLSNPETFMVVFPSSLGKGDGVLSTHQSLFQSAKLLQEKLSHYVDEVEMLIAQQVILKSDAFFHAIFSHNALSEQLVQTLSVAKALREKIKLIDKSLVMDSLTILQLKRLCCNHKLVANKLKLMAAVLQVQPTIQLLLSTPDYVAAVELISTTQDILLHELSGVHSFRYLGSQLLEMERLIQKMLISEFKRYGISY